MERVILHSDINSCYASIEHLYHPELHGKPVAVGGNEAERHGIILAKDDIAKKCGIQTGMTLWEAKRLCPELTILEPRMKLYYEFTQQVNDIYADYTDLREPFGLDESWLDLTGCISAKDGEAAAKDIGMRIKNELGVTVSIGVSWNKPFAKLGSDYKKPDAVTVIDKNRYKDIAWPLPVSDLLYVGRQTTKKLDIMGIKTIGELAGAPPEILSKRFGKAGLTIYRYANGLDRSPVRRYDLKPPPKSIGNSTTTPRDLTNYEEVKVTLTSLVETVAQRLREQGYLARVLEVSVRDSKELSWCSRQLKLERYTDITRELLSTALQLFTELHSWPKTIRSIGMRVSDMIPVGRHEQMDIFFDFEKRDRERELDSAIDRMREKYGYMSIQRGTIFSDKALGKLNAYEDRIGVFYRGDDQIKNEGMQTGEVQI